MYKEIENEEELRITEEHFNEFKNAKSFQEKISILNAHSKQNQKRINNYTTNKRKYTIKFIPSIKPIY